MSKCFNLSSFGLCCALHAASFLPAADLPRVGVNELPLHAIQVLGDDRFVFSATDAIYLDDEHVLAIGGKTATRFEVKTGRRKEVRTEVGINLGPVYLLRGGRKWVFGTRWKDDQSVIGIWDMTFENQFCEIRRDGKKQALALSHDGKHIAVLETTYNDLSIDVVDVDGGQTTDTIPPPEHHSGNSQHNPKAWFVRGGRVLVVAHHLRQASNIEFRFFHFDEKGKVGDLISTMTVSEQNNTWRLFPTRDDDHVLFVGNDGSVLLQNFMTGKTTSTVKLNGVSAFGAAVNRDKSLLAVCGNSGIVQLWDIAAQRPLRQIDTGSGSVRSVSFSPDDKTLVSASGDRVRFWETRTGRELHQRKNPILGAPVAVAISPDERRVAVADGLGRAQLWDLNTSRPIDLEDEPSPSVGGFDTWVGPNFFAFSPDGSKLIGGSNNAHNSVNIWDAKSGRRLKRVAGHRSPIMGVAYSSDGKMFASTSRDSTLRVWDEDGKLLHTFPDASTSTAFIPGADRIVACHAHGKGDGLRVYNLLNGQLEKKLHAPGENQSPWAYSVAVSPDGNQIASIHRDGILRLWDLDHDEPTREIQLRRDGVRSSHSSGCAAFSPDGKTLAATAGTKAIFLCDVKTGQVVSQLHGHRNDAKSVMFGKSGKFLVSVSTDFRIILWNARSAMEKQ